jgi:hypothetical protein
MNRHGINRRDALKTLTAAGVGAATLPLWVSTLQQVAEARATSGAAQSAAPSVFTQAQYETVDLLSDLVIPETDTAGARQARVAAFIDTILSDAPSAERDRFLDGLDWLDARSAELFGATFAAAAPEQQTALLTIVSSPENDSPADRIGVEFFQAMKSLTVTGYYTSRIGMLQELDDNAAVTFTEKLGCQHPEHKA